MTDGTKYQHQEAARTPVQRALTAGMLSLSLVLSAPAALHAEDTTQRSEKASVEKSAQDAAATASEKKAKKKSEKASETARKSAQKTKSTETKDVATSKNVDAVLEEIAVSLRKTNTEKELDGFELRDVRPNLRPDNGLSLRSDALLTTDGVMVGGLTGQVARSGTSFTLFDDPKTESSGLNISFLSRQERGGLAGTNSFEREISFGALNNDLGVSLGYAGFNLDASFSEYDNPTMSQQGFGIEAGLSFSTNRFSARLSARQYREGSDLMGPSNQFRQFISYELGAQYRLSSNFGVTGGVRYFNYGTAFLTKAAVLGDKNQVVFVGGNLRF